MREREILQNIRQRDIYNLIFFPDRSVLLRMMNIPTPARTITLKVQNACSPVISIAV